MKISISLDFELGWGVIEDSHWIERSKSGVYENLRITLPKFLQVLDDLSIPVTFGCVGAMIQSPKNRSLQHLPEQYHQLLQNFLAQAPATTIDGRDLMEKVLSAQVSHEICSHSYTHIPAQYPGAASEVLQQEVRLSQAVLQQEWDQSCLSYIFPNDQIYPLELFQNSSVRIIRIPATNLHSNPLLKQISVPQSQHQNLPNQLETLTGSLFLNWGVQSSASVKKYLTRYKANKILTTAPLANYHCWLHPFNLTHTPGLDTWLLRWLRQLAQHREEGNCEILTLAEHAQSYCQSKLSSSLIKATL